jgi:hypothetical protein
MYGRPYDTLRDTSTYLSTSGSPDGGGPEDSLSNAERGDSSSYQQSVLGIGKFILLSSVV